MSRVSEIRARRELQFYKSRMRGNAQRQREEDRKLVEENQHLLPPSERYPVQKLAEAEMEDVDVEKVKESVEKRRREIEEMELSEEEEEVPAMKQKGTKTKLRRKVGGGVESMDVDA